MATIIDALVVELGLDARDLEKKAPVSVAALKKLEGQGEKTEKGVKKIGTTSKETGKGVGELGKAVAALLSVIGGSLAIKTFVTDMIASAAAVERLSKNTGLSISTITAWSTATERLGGSAQGLQGTLSMLSKEQTNLLLKGESGLIPFFSMMGISMADAAGKGRPVVDILKDMAKFSEGKDRTTMHNIFASMGIDEQTINFILLGRKEVELRLKRQKEFGDQVAKFAPIATKFQDQLIGIKQKFELLGLQLLTDAAPALEKVFTLLEKFGDWCSQNKEFVGDFLQILAVGLGAVALAALPINLTVVAVLALAAGFALLWDDYQTWSRGGKSEFDWTEFAKGIAIAEDAIHGLRKALFFAVQGLRELNAARKGDWTEVYRLGMENPPEFKDAVAVTPASKQSSTASVSSDTPAGFDASRLAKTIMAHEGVRKKVYKDVAGKDTIGVGHLVQPGEDFSKGLDDKGVMDLLFKDISKAAAVVDQMVKVKITQNQKEALTDFVFGSGSGNFANSTLLKKLNAGDYAGAAAEFSKWNHASVNGKMQEVGALTKIRANETSLFTQSLSGIPGASSIAAGAPQAGGGSTSSVDKSIKTDIQQITINTQATDAQGIVKDLEHSFDFLFTGQFNAGLV